VDSDETKDALARALYLIQRGYPVPTFDPIQLAKLIQKKQNNK